MAVDELLLERVATQAPVLRLYGWQPPAISVGYNQSAAAELDLDKCRQDGIDVVVRPSGGRAVLHWNELTYSLAWADDEPALVGGISASSQTVGNCLVAGLQLYGLDAELHPGDRARATPTRTPRDAGAGGHSIPKAPCFASTSRWEVTCGGKKLIGSAQRRTRGGALQHGSLLLGPEHLRLSEWSCFGAELEGTSTCLSRWTTPVDEVRLTECLVEGFSQTLGVRLRRTTMSAEETATAARRASRFAAGTPSGREGDTAGGRVREAMASES